MHPLRLYESLQPVETLLDQIAVVVDPSVKVLERLWAKRVETLLPLGANAYESVLVQDSKMARNAGLRDREAGYKGPHGPLSPSELLDDAEASRVR